MKTPEEIKKGLEHCTTDGADCAGCIYRDECMEEYDNAPIQRDALAYIQQLEDHIRDLTKMIPKWISVEERLPEPYHTYLVVIKSKYSWETVWEYDIDMAGMVCSGGYIDELWNTYNDWDEGQEVHVTHWMPIPEGPKEG